MCDISIIEELKFLERYNQHFNEFLLRFDRFKQIRSQYEITKDKKLLTDFRCYIDILIVQIRSFCLENDINNKKNYTVQHFLNLFSSEESAKNLDNFLEKPLYGTKDDGYCSIKQAIKFVSDKYICHHDKLSEVGISQIDFIIAELVNPYSKINLDIIINELSKYILETQINLKRHLLEISRTK